MDALAYQLFWNMRHIKGTVYDATLVRFDGSGYVVGWKGTEQRQVPEPVLFEANFKITQQSDYPCNDVNWPLMSPRMLKVLRDVGDFPHRLIPVQLVNRRVLGPARYLPNGNLRPEVVDGRFSAVQLTQHTDVVDWEHSTFEPSRIAPLGVAYFHELVLLEPPGGLPPLFRIPSDISMLLVSAQARRAMEAAGLGGVRFDKLPGLRAGDTP